MIYNEMDLKALTGLSSQEAAERLAKDGYNELPSAKPRSIWAIALQVVREPMFLLLIASGTLYLILGDTEEALMLLGFVFVVMGITLYQERKTERALEALRDLASPRALVIRDGEQRRIVGREVVCGDIVLLSEGDRVPADGLVLSATNLSADESLLTGESVPVRKAAAKETAPPTAPPGGDDLPFVFSSTLVVKGQGIVRVLSTGTRTEIGKIGKALQTLETEETNLQRQTARIVRNFALAGLSVCVLIIVVYGLTRGDWLQGLLAGITLAMATLPEEFPVVLTIFLALGAWRLSQHRVLTRRVPAVETLGAATVLCTDKTGTLTGNRMSVTRLVSGSLSFDISPREAQPLPEDLHSLVEFSLLASPADPFDPMEKAMKVLGERTLAQTEHLHDDWSLVREYPLSEKMLAMSRVWRSPDGLDYVLAAKGAPEAIADLCHFSAEQTEDMERRIGVLAEEGLRVIGVARGRFRPANLPDEQHDFQFEFLGLLGLSDPIRPEVVGAVQECATAGVRVIMITGDYPATAKTIARQIGLASPDQVVTGAELAHMSDGELRERIKTVNIFARAVPEQKLRLVTALKANGEVVAMTGDGVNDAPALKAAHIGIAMGGRGTDVARESAALVLLDDDFSSIVQAVRMGRRIYANLRKAMAFIVSVHIPIAGLSLLPVLFGWPLILWPVHVVFLELIIDPACSVVFEMEREEANVMRRPPRPLSEPLFGLGTLMMSLAQGITVLAIVLAVFGIAYHRAEHGSGVVESIKAVVNDSRALCFATLVFANLGLIFANRSWACNVLASLRVPNKALWWVTGAALISLVALIYTPFLNNLFRVTMMHPEDWLICIGAGAASLTLSEAFKFLRNRWIA